VHILAIENDRNCPIGVVGNKLRALGAELRVLNLLQNHDAIPRNVLRRYNGLVVLGGAMGAYDDEVYPDIPRVLDLIDQFHQARKPVMGLCLGGQLLARYLGQPVLADSCEEIGFVPVHVTEAGKRDVLFEGGVEHWSPVEWHHDSLQLPAGAELLVTGESCRNQGFRAGYASYGFQFHPEMDADILSTLYHNTEGDYRLGLSAEGRDKLEQMMRQISEAIEPAEDMGKQITSRWLSLCH